MRMVYRKFRKINGQTLKTDLGLAFWGLSFKFQGMQGNPRRFGGMGRDGQGFRNKRPGKGRQFIDVQRKGRDGQPDVPDGFAQAADFSGCLKTAVFEKVKVRRRQDQMVFLEIQGAGKIDFQISRADGFLAQKSAGKGKV